MRFKANFYFNALQETTNKDNNTQSCFEPHEPFQDKTSTVVCIPGKDITFFDKNVFVDALYFANNRKIDKMYHDLIIELIVLRDNDDVECVLATTCKLIIDSNKPGCKIKPENQKLKVKKLWFDIYTIYGSSPDTDR